MQAEVVALRLVHILGGIFWVGTGLFSVLFLMPALTQAGPAAGPVMAALQQRKLYTALPVAAMLTILSGVRLMWIMSAGFSAAYFATPMGHTFAAAGLAGIAAFVLALSVARPAAMQMGKLGAMLANSAGAPDGERQRIAGELERVRRRMIWANMVAVTLVVVAAAGMAVARYL